MMNNDYRSELLIGWRPYWLETREHFKILRNLSLSQESSVVAHAALEEDADIESLITNILSVLDPINIKRARTPLPDMMNNGYRSELLIGWRPYWLETRDNLKILRYTSLFQLLLMRHWRRMQTSRASSPTSSPRRRPVTGGLPYFLSTADVLMQNVHAVHVCNWDEYVSSLCAMLPWMVAYDNNRYVRWLPDFNMSIQQPMQNYSFDQSEADTVLVSAYAALRELGYRGPGVIDAADTDAYVAAAVISQQLLVCSVSRESSR